MTRRVLTDAHSAVFEPFCLSTAKHPDHTGRDPRLFLEAVLWIVRTGAQGRELPDAIWQVELGLQAFQTTGGGRRFPASFDKEPHKWRRLIENYGGKLRENTAIATRSCKTDQSFTASISIAATRLQIA